jgi:alcohol dehydrogenase class IV
MIPEGVSVAAVIAVVVLFLRRQKESQDEFQKQLQLMQTEQLERDKLFVAAMDRLADKIDSMGVPRTNGTARRGA